MLHKRPEAPSILVTGSNGQIGFELRRSLATLGQVFALGHADCDLGAPDIVRAVVRRLRPDVIVNAAAYTAVDQAEFESELAFAVNGVAPGVLAEEACSLGSLLVHYSTDYVFAGSGDTPHQETDEVGPLSVYGKSKLAGERAIAGTNASAVVLRTCWVAGAHGTNFARTILEQGRERDTLRVVNDQFGAPTTASLIADVTARIIDRAWIHGSRAAFPSGIYHLAAAGETSWHGYATEVLRYAARKGVVLRVDPDRIEAIPAMALPRAAQRPANSRLNTRKLHDTFDIHLPEWQAGVHYLIDQILS
ncbi:dTDP-4-dehydrorhamnose reductase [Cupriavidus oxalaticus]|uniref:dTDP-4-dehydrorhamnose reductase n=1 Tax=Cupriavidus oxalaticus TaxID=96344 RepID=UPI003178AFD5